MGFLSDIAAAAGSFLKGMAKPAAAVAHAPAHAAATPVAAAAASVSKPVLRAVEAIPTVATPVRQVVASRSPEAPARTSPHPLRRSTDNVVPFLGDVAPAVAERRPDAGRAERDQAPPRGAVAEVRMTAEEIRAYHDLSIVISRNTGKDGRMAIRFTREELEGGGVETIAAARVVIAAGQERRDDLRPLLERLEVPHRVVGGALDPGELNAVRAFGDGLRAAYELAG